MSLILFDNLMDSVSSPVKTLSIVCQEFVARTFIAKLAIRPMLLGFPRNSFFLTKCIGKVHSIFFILKKQKIFLEALAWPDANLGF